MTGRQRSVMRTRRWVAAFAAALPAGSFATVTGGPAAATGHRPVAREAYPALTDAAPLTARLDALIDRSPR